MLLLGLMMAGAAAVDTITANLLPITARLFTSDLTLIGAILAINRVCGFVVQPYAAWKSDRHWSAGGRRRPFLLVAWPVTMVCVGLLGSLTYIVPADLRNPAVIIVLLFGINLAMQASLDVCFGTGLPLYGDRFPSGTIGRANAIRSVFTSAALVGMMSVAIPLSEEWAFLPYLAAMILVAISWWIARFGIRETRPERLPPPGRYHPLLPLAELRDPHTRKVAAVASAALASSAVTEMFHALFVIETLGLSLAGLGWSTSAGIVVSFLCPYPVGLAIDRFGARSVLIAGFSLLVLVELGLAFWVDDLVSLTIALVVFRVARVLVQIPVVPLMFHNTTADRRGSIFAGLQMTRAALASGAVLVAGYVANLAGSYRICYILAGIACLVGLVCSLRLAPMGRRGGPEPAAV